MKKRVTLYLDEDMWRDFRATCIRRGNSASQIVDILIQEQMTAWMMAGEIRNEPNDSQIDSHDKK